MDHSPSFRIRQGVPGDEVAELVTLVRVLVRDHHVDRQPVGMPLQPILPEPADVGDLGKHHADGTGRPDGLDLQPFLRCDAAGNANGTSRLATGALAATNSASAGLATYGAPAGTDPWPVGVTAGISTQHGGSVPWAWSMTAQTATEAANANNRPRPLANRSLPTNSTLLSCPTRCGNLRYLLRR